MKNLLSRTLTNSTHARVDKPPIILHKFPHLIESDSAIWRRFLIKNPKYFQAVSYDIHVGKGTDPGDTFSTTMRQMAIGLTQRRIDVLAERHGKIWIVEIKHDPGVSVVGQILSYEVLLRQQLIKPPRMHLCMISNRADDDLITCLNSKNIKYFIA